MAPDVLGRNPTQNIRIHITALSRFCDTRLSCMGLAKQTVARAQRLEAKLEEQRRYLLKAAEATAEGAPHLGMICEITSRAKLANFVADLPAAEFPALGSFGRRQSDGANNCRANGKAGGDSAWPSVPDGDLRGILAWIIERETAESGRFRFTVDSELRPCFTDECGHLHPHQVGDRLLKPVFDFVLRHPPMKDCFW